MVVMAMFVIFHVAVCGFHLYTVNDNYFNHFRKFGDIGNTVAQQYGGGSHSIVEWAHLITAHGLPGDGIIKGQSYRLE